MTADPRVLVLEEMRKQTALLARIAAKLDPPVAETALSGPHGDPLVKAKDPRDWTGDSMNGKHFSECPAEYLDLLADRYDFFAGREEDATKKRYNELDAKRARGWAARLRSGWTPPLTAAPTAGGDW